MDYIKIRPLIYRDRRNLDEFGVEDESSINSKIYEALLTLRDLSPRFKGVFSEILRVLNDSYFYLTLIFMVEHPLELYPDISADAENMSNGFEWMEGDNKREMTILSILHILLLSFGEDIPSPQKKLHKFICDDLDKYYTPQSALEMINPLAGDKDPVVYKMTNSFQSNICNYTIPKQDYTPRNINEVIDGDEKLENCLLAGSSIVEAVNTLCYNKEQKLKLIGRLLEPEKDGYGVMDSRVSAAYRSLYELRAELTGEPLPEKLPFERSRETMRPLMIPTPIPMYREQDEEEDEDQLEQMKADEEQQQDAVDGNPELHQMEEEEFENIDANQKVRMEVAYRLMRKAGMKPHGLTKQRIAEFMSMLLDIKSNNIRGNKAQTCATYLSARLNDTKKNAFAFERYKDITDKVKSRAKELGIDISLDDNPA